MVEEEVCEVLVGGGIEWSVEKNGSPSMFPGRPGLAPKYVELSIAVPRFMRREHLPSSPSRGFSGVTCSPFERDSTVRFFNPAPRGIC